MAFTRPNPKGESEKKRSETTSLMMEAEKLIQIAVLLPCSTIAGWLLGAWLGRVFHQGWMGVTGLLVGGVLGILYVVRLAFLSLKDTEKLEPEEKDSEGN